MRKKLDYEYCSASPILEWLGDKWALVVLLKLHENGIIRFNELYKTIPSISEKMLSTVLRSLVTDGKHPIKYTLYFHKIENSISTLVKS